jgi:Protein of unknown function (DUF402)
VTGAFDAGDVAVLRYLWFGRSFWEIPTRVVEDGAERTVVWVAPGTRYRRPHRRLTMAEIAANAWTAGEHSWTGNGTLMISRRGDPYSLWLFWDDDGSHASWYVNLELPWRRTSLGFDTRDHQLDIVIRADGAWRWKDEDELRDAIDVGLLRVEEARRIHADGEGVIAQLHRLVPTGFEDWRPAPDWEQPVLPENARAR